MNAITERFIEIFDELVAKGMSKSNRQIAIAIDLKPSQITEARKGLREVPVKYADDLQQIYNVNKLYILEGKGEKFLPAKSEQNVNKQTGNTRDLGEIQYPIETAESPFIDLGEGLMVMLVPLVNERAHAGYLSGYADPEWVEELPKHTITVRKEHRGLYRAFEVLGDSMTDGTERSINDGSIVTGRFLLHHHWRAKLNYRRYPYWVIVHKTEGIITKEIIGHNIKTGYITIHSLNPDKESYPDREIHLDEIKELYNIVHVGKNL